MTADQLQQIKADLAAAIAEIGRRYHLPKRTMVQILMTVIRELTYDVVATDDR